jgi:hypothetical protein
MRLTLLQMMKLVVGCALATAYVLPFVRLAEDGIASWAAMLSVGAIGVPLVLALTARVLAREGPFREWLILVLGMTSVGVAFGVCAYGWYTAVAAWVGRGSPTDLHSLVVVADLGLPVVVLGFIFIRLLPKVARAWRRDPRLACTVATTRVSRL